MEKAQSKNITHLDLQLVCVCVLILTDSTALSAFVWTNSWGSLSRTPEVVLSNSAREMQNSPRFLKAYRRCIFFEGSPIMVVIVLDFLCHQQRAASKKRETQPMLSSKNIKCPSAPASFGRSPTVLGRPRLGNHVLVPAVQTS